jgi:GNAT superfamily N-acetyltransferase
LIRRAEAADVAAIARIVAEAYGTYVTRIGREPGPMGDDYAARVAAGEAFVYADARGIAGLVVLVEKPDWLLLDNIAVAPERQGEGFGRCLLDFADAEAVRRGFREIRLYTHALMHENIAMYGKLGWQEYARGEEAGFSRVFMRKATMPTPQKED